MKSYRWVRHGWSGRAWVLRDGEREVARLARRGWSMRLTLQADGRLWDLRTVGFWRPTIRLLDDAGVERAHARLRMGAAEVHGLGKGPMAWRRTSWWRSTYELQQEGWPVAARFHGRWTQSPVEADPKQPDLVLLLAIGWAVHLYHQAQAAASSAAIGGAVAVSASS